MSSSQHSRRFSHDSMHLRLSSRRKRVSGLQTKLLNSHLLADTLNDSVWKLNEQSQVYAAKIGYEKDKNKELTQAFAKREAQLVHTVQQKEQLIRELTQQNASLQARTETADNTVVEAYHQFDITRNSLVQQVTHSSQRVQHLTQQFEQLQAAVTQTTQQLRCAQEQQHAAAALVNAFQHALVDKNEALRREKVRARESKVSGQALVAQAQAADAALGLFKKQCREEQLQRLRTELGLQVTKSQ